jgi:cyclic beta-1,2-glucan synthetase
MQNRSSSQPSADRPAAVAPSLRSVLHRATGYDPRAVPWENDELLRAELFSIERMEQHAASLALAQQLRGRRVSARSLGVRLRDNESVLLAAYRSTAAAIRAGRPISPAAEWLLDNFHLVEAQIRQIYLELPPGFYRQLPKLGSGPLAGYPRIFGIAWAFIAHTDSRFDGEALRRFVLAYQRVQALTIGELWAIAITLRILLVENLRRAAALMDRRRREREQADAVADRLLGLNGYVVEPDALSHCDSNGSGASPAFLVQLVLRLRDQDPRATPALQWLEQRMTSATRTADEFVQEEHHRQGAANVTVRNIITSMRVIADLDWRDFFESVSLVDELLRSGSGFAELDFPTRDLYRRAIERLARGSRVSELQIAQAALTAAAREPVLSEREREPGYYLIAGGLEGFQQSIGYRVSPWRRLGRISLARGASDYLGVIAVITGLLLTLCALLLHGRGLGALQLALLLPLGLLPTLDAALALVNRAVMRGFGATILPGMALRTGVPASLRTLVVVPTLLTSPAAVKQQIQRLEVHYLASRDGELYFALLSDWNDAAAETLPEDRELLELAVAGIARLNRLHAAGAAGPRFLLLHRARSWSEGQRQWIGWERKRGKLHELNRLLRGATDTHFLDTGAGAALVPSGVRYVLTLDADTRLPRDAARRLIAKMAHPLNRPRLDPLGRHVVEGYAVLQPRIAAAQPVGSSGSLYQYISSSANGIDPYATAVSDVYQDLFDEGSYAGKGIYDVDAFEASLANRVPDGTLLSHDLFEGLFARSGLASDIELVEEFPARYDVAIARQHRWARGDWQLLPWILGRADAATPLPGGSAFTLVSLWKMLDNLRRTLWALATIVALLAGWLLPADCRAPWTCFVVAMIALPALLPVLPGLLPAHAGITWRSHWRAVREDIALAVLRTVCLITFLAHQAWWTTDAICRTLFRLFLSRRNLLQWVTAAQASLSAAPNIRGAYRRMSGSVACALLGAVLVGCVRPAAWPLAAPFIALWLAAPALAVWLSLPPAISGRLAPEDPDRQTLRLIARRTWRYFEAFVSAEDHALPPDNFQQDPQPVLAHRTSPTNLGLYLLATVSARDYGWISTREMVERLEATLATMGSLQRFRGHFYNWYDTRDLRPLEPRYVSSVDSGNLAAHLLAVAAACREFTDASVAAPAREAGIADGVDLALEAWQALSQSQRTQAVVTLRPALEALSAALGDHAGWRESPAAQLLQVRQRAMAAATVARGVEGEPGSGAPVDLLYWTGVTEHAIEAWQREATQTDEELSSLRQRLATLQSNATTMYEAMQFGFLLDPERQLLAIGYRVEEGIRDPSCYDLLASEARLASFIAIAKNDLPAKHWFQLGRSVTPVGNGGALISWSGSMFEYLMPLLVMHAPFGSLLEQTNRLIVRRQRSYGRDCGVPWGVSESAYNARDLEFTYQYSSFGVPDLGLKPGLGKSCVVAPYATALAAMVDPKAAVRNLGELLALGARGRYGFFEALDFTRSHLPHDSTVAIVQAFMAHHQGMTIVAIANALFDGRMRERFHAEPSIQATELLLQERGPRDIPTEHPRAEEVRPEALAGPQPEERRLFSPHQATPQIQLLSNGRYTVMITACGSGYSRWRDLALTRWNDDATREDSGSYIFLRDLESGSVWSAGYQPTAAEPGTYETTFTEDRVQIRRTEAAITTQLDVVVSPEDDAEVRHVSIANCGRRVREIEVTSYCELVLASRASDVAHAAFSKLFVQTERFGSASALLATRRRRTPAEPELWMAHHAVIDGELLSAVEVETDRARFLGRAREIRSPAAMAPGRRLSDTTGIVLDPVFSLRVRLRIAPGASASIDFWSEVASSRQGVLDLIDRHHEPNAYLRASTLAWTQAQIQLRHLGIDAAEAGLFQSLAGHLLFANATMRPPSEIIRRGGGAQPALWAEGISGDLPIVLLRIDRVEDAAIVRTLLRAHGYWRMKQFPVDLVILNERAASYVQDLQNALETQLRTSGSLPQPGADNVPGSVYVLRSDLIPEATRELLTAVARVVLVARRGSLAEQLGRVRPPGVVRPRAQARTAAPQLLRPEPIAPDLEFFNGLGGFAAAGREYLIHLGAGQSTPAPWINVIANPKFGFQVATEGSGFTWSLNSQLNQLTPWSNDPVSDRPGECLYLRDEVTGEVWGPTAMPIRVPGATYTARHGQGYSRFEHHSHGVALELLVYVPMDDPIKISRLRIRNTSGQTRKLSLTAYVEWVLGASRSATAPHVVTDIDAPTGALFARNPWSTSFGSRVAFADLAAKQTGWTADRQEFIGRLGTLERPAALESREPLSRRVGAGLDPCGALQCTVELKSGETTELAFFLGEADHEVAARALLLRYRASDLDAVLASVVEYWDQVLGAVQVSTPDRSLDLMVNRWLLYQTLSCRIWARAGFYQASGAYGFRDQLQDGMALAVTRPALTREHLLRAASRQFKSGDVQHWWQPAATLYAPSPGVRTRISDDRVWLPFATAQYVETSGDGTVLDELIPFLDGPELLPGEADAYFQPTDSGTVGSLFEHCALALDQSLGTGAHGLPLIGTGDWNDGMNRVGPAGKGESVWLGWFLAATLWKFAPLARARAQHARAALWLSHAAGLRDSLEREAWDGSWYRRAYFDDGRALGTASGTECRIDSIAQSWSAISGAATPERALEAMSAVRRLLLQPEPPLALLLAPPFGDSATDPGYIGAYPPGIRENGGQYSHAAAWSVIAFALLGQGAEAAAVFSILNPVTHARTPAEVQRYKVEPYVVAADIYSVDPHAGRGGWTWYTGSAGWMYRAAVEWMLGFRVQGTRLLLTPCIPACWPGFQIVFRYRSSRYTIVVENPDHVGHGAVHADLDGRRLPPGVPAIELIDDGQMHRLTVILGQAAAARASA